jgi:PAS domain S-box-containing protein
MSPLKDPRVLRGIIENGPDAIVLFDRNGVYLAVNHATEELLGLPRTALLGRSFKEAGFLEEADLPRALDLLAVAGRGESTGPETFAIRRPDGERLHCQIRTQTMGLSGQPLIILIARDVTEQKASEHRSRLLSTAIAQAAEAVIITTAEGVIEYVNPAFEAISGYACDEAVGKNPSLLKSGEQGAAFYRSMWTTILSGRVWVGRLINRRKDGSLYEEESTISPVRSESGRIEHFVAVKRDVSRVVELERQLRQSQKMEALGVLAGGIAHDFNNILTPILGYAQLARKSLPEGSQDGERMEQIINASLRAKDLVRQILTFSRKSEGRVAPVELGALVKESLKFMRHGIPLNVQVQSRIPPQVGSILGDPTQIHQVFLNLLTNAAQAMAPGGGTITVGLDSVTVGEDTPGLPRGRYLRLRIQDTGSGMSPGTLSRVFEPFFSTKKVGEGTGLGLSVVHGIVASHGGHIVIDSRIGEGTEVEVFLPQIAMERRQAPPAPEAAPGSGRILVVDDQEGVLLVVSEMLEDLGYTTATFESGLAALEFVRAHPGEADLLITDQAMPGMSGSELVQQVAQADPGLPAIIMTGHDAMIPEPENGGPRPPVLRKPFETGVLARTVSRHARRRKGMRAA